MKNAADNLFPLSKTSTVKLLDMCTYPPFTTNFFKNTLSIAIAFVLGNSSGIFNRLNVQKEVRQDDEVEFSGESWRGATSTYDQNNEGTVRQIIPVSDRVCDATFANGIYVVEENRTSNLYWDTSHLALDAHDTRMETVLSVTDMPEQAKISTNDGASWSWQNEDR